MTELFDLHLNARAETKAFVEKCNRVKQLAYQAMDTA